MRNLKRLLYVLLLLSALPASAQEASLRVGIKGFADTYHAVRSGGKTEWMSSRTRIRGELSLDKGGTGLFVSSNAIFNALMKDQTRIELREAYLYYGKSGWDIRAGRQIIIWGISDGLQVNDRISPMDYSEFLAQDYDDIRIPVNSLKIKYSTANFSLEGVAVPIPDYFRLPTDPANPWSVGKSLLLPATFDLDSGKPAKNIANMEFGARAAAYLSGADFSFYALRTWNKMPALSIAVNPAAGSLQVTGHHHRLTILGADLSVPLGRFVFRGEGAFYFKEAQGAAMGGTVADRNTLNALGGVDWYPGNDWNISLQYCHKYIGGDLGGLSVPCNTGLATCRIAKDLLRNTLKLSSFAYVDVTHGGIFNRLSASYAFNDELSLALGYDYFHADKGPFVLYKDNSEIWAKLRYNF